VIRCFEPIEKWEEGTKALAVLFIATAANNAVMRVQCIFCGCFIFVSNVGQCIYKCNLSVPIMFLFL